MQPLHVTVMIRRSSPAATLQQPIWGHRYGIWDNGAACGRQYLVRCISAAVPRFCKPGQTIQIKIVDQAETLVSKPSREGVSIVLSSTAYGLIADASAASVNIEFKQ
ncbi:hypothetical protein SLEP1_g28499 [Rubroshorea leprosula]|uniref:Expansin-like EG45 domain-containing protein n=1 Tax=Rubroshorea leprosula TaxID=152421 RepID=A0AAV5JZZ9_9ROSI|nr:hypothetical protein SLEP1_g28499 [Rubroshorea leprosula]